MSKVIGILSGKGGVGKTTLVANLGAALTKAFSKNILIFDSNINTSHLGLHLGIYEDLPVTIREVLRSRMPVTSAIYMHPATGIRLIPAPLSGDGVALTREKCSRMVDEVKNNYDMVLLDTAPGLGKEVMVALSAIDEAIIITTPDIPAVTDALKALNMLKKLGIKPLGIVVNRRSNEKYELTDKEISSTCGSDVIATIPEDRRVLKALSKGIPAVISYPNSRASQAVKNLAARLVGIEYRKSGFLEGLMKLFGFGGVKKQDVLMRTEKMVSPDAEVKDMQKLRDELVKEVKDGLKKELVEGIKKRLKERGG